VIDAAGQAQWFQVGIELVAIRYGEKVGRGFLARRESRLGNTVEWGTDKERGQERRGRIVIGRGRIVIGRGRC
jgi:hypothetical protein